MPDIAVNPSLTHFNEFPDNSALVRRILLSYLTDEKRRVEEVKLPNSLASDRICT